MLQYVPANRDESKFAEPWLFDVRRHPNPHVGFGGGGVPSASLRIWSWRILLPNSRGDEPLVKWPTLLEAPHATRWPEPG